MQLLLNKTLNLSNPNFYFIIVLSVLNGLLLCFISYKFIQALQLSDYKASKYFLWFLKDKGKNFTRIFFLTFLTLSAILVTSFLFVYLVDNELLVYLGLIFYFTFAIYYIVRVIKAPQKTPLKITNRVLRLEICLFIVNTALTFGFLTLFVEYSNYFKLMGIPILIIFVPIIVLLGNFIMLPFEHFNKLKYQNRAIRKINKMPNLIKIGITGSYGKTSTKNFLYDLLKRKYKVVKTPSSYNTPMGITKTILNYVEADTQVFIAEFGAYFIGDIEYLTKLIKPQVCAITSVGNQHLESFKTLENIKNTKNEIVEYSPKDATCVFNIDCKTTNDLYNNSSKNKVSCKINDVNADVTALNISYNENGANFTLKVGEKQADVCTNVLGEFMINDLLIAVGIALKVGMTFEEIVKYIKKVKPVENRLELKKLNNGLLILDDSFNANVLGAEQAINTLSLFKDRTKVVATPGIVELGKDQESANIKFGEQIACVANKVIIINKVNAKSIKEGLLNKGFSEENIFEVDNLFVAKDLLKKVLKPNDIVLIENDLPDNYT